MTEGAAERQSTEGDPRKSAAWTRSDWGWLALVASSASLLATLPHLILRIKTGEVAYIPDWDGVLYLAWSRDMVLKGGRGLVDAVHPQSGPMMHPWLLFGPIAILARGLKLDMVGLAILWRVAAGISLTFSLAFALKPFLKTPRLVAAATLFLLFDPGLALGQPIQAGWSELVAWLRNDPNLFRGNPSILNHFRVVTPALASPFLFVFFGLTWRARLDPRPRAKWLAALGFGFLYYAYFYFWTAVFAGTVSAFLLDPKGRRFYARILIVGTVVGLPGLIENVWLKQATGVDWLVRTEKFAPLGRFEGLLIFKGLILKYAIVGLWIFRARRELIQSWCVGIAAIALMNHQIVTQLNIENFHWSQTAGFTWSLLATILIVGWAFGPDGERAERWESSARRATRLLLIVAFVLQVPLGFFLRAKETTEPKNSQYLERALLSYRTDAPKFAIPSGSVVAGDGDFFMIGASLTEMYPLSGRLVDFCSKADDREMEERLMLNAFLFGFTREEAGELARDPAKSLRETWWIGFVPRGDRIARRRALRSALIAPIWDDPQPWLAKYRVDDVVLPIKTAKRPPSEYLKGIAERVAVGSTWECWRVLKPSRANPPKTPRPPDRS